MAAPATIDEFLDLVRKSGVADERRFEAHLQRLRQTNTVPREPNRFAGILIRDGFLTQFQAEQLLQGKWRRFTIGKYKVLEKLGSGGMGQVYLCEHKLMRRRVAVKVLPTAKAADASSLERFYREARAVAALDHPNIVHAYDIDQDENLHFLVMEYVDGSSLQDIIKKTGPMNVLRACHYIRQAALGLDHAHQSGLVHRDIKPGNILVDRSGVVKVLDMGLARFFNDEEDILTKKYNEDVLGTADYLSPEQAIDSHGVDIRADIYSLGATFYFMLTGKTPFGEGPIAQKLIWHQTRHPKPVQELRPEVPPGVAAVITKMMAKDPAQRYQVPGQVAEALAPFTQTPIAPPPDAEMPHLSPAATGNAPADTTPETVVRGPTSPSLRAVTPSPMRSASLPPVASPMPTSRSAPPVAQPIQPALVAQPPVEQEEPAWDQLEPDTQNPLARGDTTPDSKRRRKNLTEEVFKTQKKRVWLVVIIAAIPIIAILVILGIVFVANAPPPAKKGPVEEEKEEPRREKLIVRKGGSGKAVFPTLRAALRDARNGETIEIQDEVLEENLYIDGTTLAANVTIQAAPGKKVLWKSATKDPIEPILRLSSTAKLPLSGRGITFDGTLAKGVVRDLIVIQYDCPGLKIENLTFKNFDRSAVAFLNAKGTETEPIRLGGLLVLGPAKSPTGGAVILDAGELGSGSSFNDHIVIEDDCRFVEFPPGKAIVPIRSSAVGKNVQVPK